jgi:hypothetical protein
MRRYKLYLVGGRVLEFEAKTARLETGPLGGDRLVLRGEKDHDRAEFTWSHLLGYTSGDLLVDGGAS